MTRFLVRIALSLACLLPALALAQQPTAGSATANIDIPAGSLVTALDTLARQTGVQFVYSADQLAGLRTRGVHGQVDAGTALNTLLEGTGYRAHSDDSGAMVIVKDTQARPSSAKPKASPAESASEPDEDKAKTLGKVLVTGSRIPRTEIEGPSPVVTITANDIQQRGLVTVPDIMTSLTQNVGELRNNQFTNSFAPGAQAVDLRGLGPSYTLVLVNGRRFADYPAAYRGNSNFSDISNIPTALIDRVEILSGSASAVYGSDAISGVINFILKDKVDGTTLDYRIGRTEHGGMDSQRLHITSGFSTDKLDTVFGLELFQEKPLYDFQRSYTDSRLDSPADPEDIVASGVFVREDAWGYYLDPGKDTCDALSYLDEGTVFYAERPGWGYGGPGYFCGSYDDVGYGTLHNGRKMANLYASATYHFNDNTDFYVNVLAGTSHQDSLNSTLQWRNCETENGECTDTPFYNAATGQVEQWQRRYFTIEENGGLKNALARNIINNMSLNAGVKGTFGGDSYWDYEANFGHSHNDLKTKYPNLVAARAQALYLGPSLGIDPDSGLKIFDAPPERLYTPLTVSEFQSISQDSIDRNHSRTENWSFKLTNTELFELPAGPVGFAAIAEYGNSYLEQNVDPMSLDGSYYGLHGTSATGSRSHGALGSEFRVPVFSNFNVTAAGRYDRFEYGKASPGKFTYTFGLEYRPWQSLLLRGSYSTGFRAPDLSYLFSGLSGSSSGGTDYYLCRRDEPEAGPDYYEIATTAMSITTVAAMAVRT